nr:MAG TPA: hypothetical protein [Caudoviricetes sp.]
MKIKTKIIIEKNNKNRAILTKIFLTCRIALFL